jgi:hypothetical protein
VELKVEDYRYIPETLAGAGRVQLAERQLGMMIGLESQFFCLNKQFAALRSPFAINLFHPYYLSN